MSRRKKIEKKTEVGRLHKTSITEAARPATSQRFFCCCEFRERRWATFIERKFKRVSQTPNHQQQIDFWRPHEGLEVVVGLYLDSGTE